MILNTGGRTDTVQYYSEWLLNRFREGYVLSRNPLFPEIVNRIDLNPETIDVVVFCSKDYSPIMARLHEIYDRFNCYYHYTITAYGEDIEPRVPSIENSIETLKRLADQVGAGKIAWRYDPVLLTDKYTIQRHLDTFGHMASELAPYVDRCIFSFVEMNKKLEVNMLELRPVSETDKLTLAKGMGAIARQTGLYLQTCAMREDYESFGIHRSGCMTVDIISKALGVQFKKVSHKGNRAGCLCIESRGLGDYNSCPNGCRYCYANKDHEKALQNYLTHDPDSPLLLGHLQPADIVKPLKQESFLSREPSLFD
ncbi:MAG: DUF1848 domain-containing protein [Bacteroidales bacterium]|nr:DUF1848 domain-containing protein [Bacteroidales bacterium]